MNDPLCNELDALELARKIRAYYARAGRHVKVKVIPESLGKLDFFNIRSNISFKVPT